MIEIQFVKLNFHLGVNVSHETFRKHIKSVDFNLI